MKNMFLLCIFASFYLKTIGDDSQLTCLRIGQGTGLCAIAGMPELMTPITIGCIKVGALSPSLIIPPAVPAAMGCCIITHQGFLYCADKYRKSDKSGDSNAISGKKICAEFGCCLLGAFCMSGSAQLCGSRLVTGCVCAGEAIDCVKGRKSY
jgi:hypothetical protein